MSKYRSIIKDAARDLLLGQTIAGDRVFSTMDRPINENDLPIIIIYTVASKRGEDYGRGLTTRKVTVRIEAALSVENPYAADSVAEDFSDVVEGILNADMSWGNQVACATWQETVSDVSSVSETVIANVLLEYEVEYQTDLREDSFFGGEDDGFTEPPTSVKTRPDVNYFDDGIFPDRPKVPQPPPDTACDPDNGCNIPAWQGEVGT